LRIVGHQSALEISPLQVGACSVRT
jgi:hypothetical protein